MRVRNPRAEAQALLEPGHEARVLEPSPPADTDPEWYADDPTDPSGAAGTVVSPISDGDLTWDEYARRHPEVAEFVRRHHLSRLDEPPTIPDSFTSTREALHQVAFYAVAPRRYRAVGKLGLRWTRGGFGTPFFGDDVQVRVEGGALVVQEGRSVRHREVTDLAAACRFLEIPYEETWFEGFHDPLQPVGPTAPLEIDPAAAEALGDWFGFVTLVLEELRRTPGAVDVGRVQLWPEHFDVAVELGSAEAGLRASYGGSPGDSAHPEPYLYVAAWSEVDRSDPYWNDESFNGASLGYSELRLADQPFVLALEFFRKGYGILNR